MRRRCLILSVLATHASAQTFVVDATGGPGASFTSIAAAIAAVPSGSVLLVRPGAYGPFTIQNVALTILGDPGVIVSGAITVGATTPLQSVVVSGLSCIPAAPVFLQQCQGPVHLHAVVSWPAFGGAALRVNACDQVVVTDCVFTGSSLNPAGASIDTSRVALAGTQLGAVVGHRLTAIASDVVLADCLVQGGLAGHGALLSASTVRLLGATSVAKGQPPGSGTQYAMFGTGVVSLGPSVTTNGGIAVPTSPTSEAALQVSDATPGAPMTATLAGTAGALGALVFANQGPPFVVPEITGALWLQPASAIAVAAGVFGTTLPVTVNVPNDPALLAQSFAWQGLTWSSVSGFAASNPGWFTIR